MSAIWLIALIFDLFWKVEFVLQKVILHQWKIGQIFWHFRRCQADDWKKALVNICFSWSFMGMSSIELLNIVSLFFNKDSKLELRIRIIVF